MVTKRVDLGRRGSRRDVAAPRDWMDHVPMMATIDVATSSCQSLANGVLGPAYFDHGRIIFVATSTFPIH